MIKKIILISLMIFGSNFVNARFDKETLVSSTTAYINFLRNRIDDIPYQTEPIDLINHKTFFSEPVVYGIATAASLYGMLFLNDASEKEKNLSKGLMGSICGVACLALMMDGIVKFGASERQMNEFLVTYAIGIFGPGLYLICKDHIASKCKKNNIVITKSSILND